MDQALNQKIDAYIAQNKEQLLKDIAALVAVNSVEGTPEEGAPYGAGPRAALDKTLELAAGMGLATRNCENYIGYAELAGKDPEKYLATICHVDVVPVGNGWTADPFTMRIQDGWLLGRGVADDKGPMVATLYALKFLKEQGYELRYPIRALAGTNEETHMQDVDYYLKNYPAPAFCFTPDAEFPVCNGEKGLFGAKIVSPVCNGVIVEIEGGVANNAVPDRASALVRTDISKLKNAPNITLEPEGDGVRIRGWGKSGHAAMPQGTVNAIGLVVNYLLDNGLCNETERAYLEAVRKLHASTAGEGLGERPEPILSSRTAEHDADSSSQSQSQQDNSQDTSASTDSSPNAPDQSQGAESPVNNNGTQSGTTDSSQTTDGSQPSTGDQTSGNTSGTGSTDNGNTNSSGGTASGTASDSSSQGTTSGN